MSLAAYGWTEHWAHQLAETGDPPGDPARVIAQHRELYRIYTGQGEVPARVAGRLRHLATAGADLPAVGDWVVIARGEEDGEASIQAVLPRRTKFSRKAAGSRTEEQVAAANVDQVWIVSAFGPDLNPARIERYLALVWEGGASPVVILTKSDLVEDPVATVAELETRIIGVPICALSVVDGRGLGALDPLLVPGRTIAMLGSSGVGKSTLLNHLSGHEVMPVAGIRERLGKGRHTTTHRQLFLLPGGGLLLDTPGMREIQLWSAEAGIDREFVDIAELAAGCRFADCQHESEPGCAVLAAAETGDLEPERLASYRKLRKESAYLERKLDVRSRLEEERRWKSIMKDYRRNFKKKD